MQLERQGELRTREIQVRAPSGVWLRGDLTVPPQAVGMVLFAHGSGSSRFSPRNRNVARRLVDDRFATLLLDLLTPEEEQVDAHGGRHRFDIPLLAQRLITVADWSRSQPELADLPIGLFGASTGAAAALVAAADRPDRFSAVVSRGGRPDLAGEALPDVRCPTLLIVGGADRAVVDWNDQASRRLRCTAEVSIVPEATHLFEEPGALAIVARRASEWFGRYLRRAEKELLPPKTPKAR